jgi:hypothetical protein
MFTVILSDESVNFFTFSLIYLCKSESQKVFAQFTDGLEDPLIVQRWCS